MLMSTIIACLHRSQHQGTALPGRALKASGAAEGGGFFAAVTDVDTIASRWHQPEEPQLFLAHNAWLRGWNVGHSAFLPCLLVAVLTGLALDLLRFAIGSDYIPLAPTLAAPAEKRGRVRQARTRPPFSAGAVSVGASGM